MAEPQAPAGGAPAAPAATPSLMGSGEPGAAPAAPTTPEWAQGLPDDLKASPEVARYTDLAGFVKGQHELRAAFDGKIPTAESTDEERGSFWDKLGRPETPAGYDLKAPADLPEGMIWDESAITAAAETAHKLGLSAAQFKGMVALDTASKVSGKLKQEEEIEIDRIESVTELKKEWGGAYEQELKRAAVTARAFCTDEQFAELEKSGLNDDPTFIKFASRLGLAMGESTRPEGMQAVSRAMMTPADAGNAQADIATNKENPLHAAFHDDKNTDHKKAVDEFGRLGKMKRGGVEKTIHLD